ncbi:MAG: DNA polymerase III subunit gamma/tau [Erysipelotrichaceae bacterium]|nr:DNA polymerase III subunit gamma/tau [Erysipelotrichaceae bacterium]
MAYQALYRKYRPSSFDEVVGQQHVVKTLENAIARDRIAHAYLFAGPRGTGKTSIAKIFAKTLNCTGEHAPCGKCDNCLAAAEQSHPDIIEIDAASNNGVDEVRSLIERVSYAPMMGKYKIYIIDEVHMMTTGAFNALLKTIEEPPAHVIFILATTEPHKVISTILSRCQRFDFTKVSDEEITGRLETVCKEENVPYEKEALELIASLSDGGMRDSLSILDQSIAYSPDLISLDAVRDIYGVVTRKDIGLIFSQMNEKEIEKAVQSLQDIYNKGFDLKRFISDFISLLKNSLLMDFNEQTTLISESEKQILHSYFLQISSEKRIDLVRDLMEIYNKLGFASNVLDYIETILLKYAYQKSEKTNVNSYEEKISVRTTQKPASEKRYELPVYSQNSPKNSGNRTLSTQFWESDVSRETLHPKSELKKTVKFEDEFLLSLLSGANKNCKAQDMQKLKNLEIYMSNLEYAKFAASLRRFKVIGSAETYILMGVQSDIQANEINELQNDQGYEKFMNEIIGKPKKLFAVSLSHAKHLIDQFKERMKNGTLPSPAVVELDKAETQDSGEKQVEFLKSVFKELNVVED